MHLQGGIMEIKLTITREELLNFHMNHITETKDYKYAVAGNNAYMILVLLFIIVILHRSYLIFVAIITWFVLLLFRKKYMLYRLRKRLKKIFLFEKYNDYFESAKLIMNENGLNSISNLSEKIYKWKSIKDIYLVDNYIFIRTITHDDILIPISSFNSTENKDFFISTVIKNTNLQLKNKYPIDFKYQ